MTLDQIILVMLAPAFGWLVYEVLRIKTSLAALEAAFNAEKTDSSRRITEIRDDLKIINTKIDTLLSRGQDRK